MRCLLHVAAVLAIFGVVGAMGWGINVWAARRHRHQLAAKRQFGALKGQISIGPEFFEPLPEEELAAWEGEPHRDKSEKVNAG